MRVKSEDSAMALSPLPVKLQWQPNVKIWSGITMRQYSTCKHTLQVHRLQTADVFSCTLQNDVRFNSVINPVSRLIVVTTRSNQKYLHKP